MVKIFHIEKQLKKISLIFMALAIIIAFYIVLASTKGAPKNHAMPLQYVRFYTSNVGQYGCDSTSFTYHHTMYQGPYGFRYSDTSFKIKLKCGETKFIKMPYKFYRIRK